MAHLPPEEYYKSLPKKMISAGVVLLNSKKELLIVKPSYRDYWEIPGGIVESNESIYQAGLREVREELGLDVVIESLLCIDYRYGTNPVPDSLQTILKAKDLTPEQISNIEVDGTEIVEFGFFLIDEAYKLLHERIAQRIRHGLNALEKGGTAYLEEGEEPVGEKAPA